MLSIDSGVVGVALLLTGIDLEEPLEDSILAAFSMLFVSSFASELSVHASNILQASVAAGGKRSSPPGKVNLNSLDFTVVAAVVAVVCLILFADVSVDFGMGRFFGLLVVLSAAG
eukprot:CAMPEP_0118632876 /NCGR_PEP_ID=MMETSP0785-20121206/687_1 /TAXON_ID=91992 /ORGANISM="Bolidomonas pacifica, Strain CCMP 1866" /LENGTH=114 /DNA_ID=CAMNT_0006523693 /DNA_START=817 /DNA_END=1161 /DNA_ORIENTATION=+